MVRVEFLEPSELRGYILVADQEKMESRMYQPINNQIAVRGLEDASKEVLSTLSISDLETFFDFSEYSVEVLEAAEEDEVMDYLLEVDALDELQVRVKRHMVPMKYQCMKAILYRHYRSQCGIQPGAEQGGVDKTARRRKFVCKGVVIVAC